MVYSYEWLKQFVPRLPKPEVLAEQLTMHAVEVEGVRRATLNLGHVVVAEVLAVRKHPNADTLHIGQFNVGESQPRQVVFGGKAVLKKGMRIAVALAPTVLPSGVKIVERRLRGEVSQGMCCLNSELGILDNREVLHHFDSSVAPGTMVVDCLELGDTVLEIENVAMTQRADLLSHQFMAAEIAAVCNLQFQFPQVPPLPQRLPPFPIVIKDKRACRRYIGMECTVTMRPTPDFIVRRLNSCGVKSINVVVDITNYVMLELGQPLHAFDADRLNGGIVVRRAVKGERLQTLDHNTYSLQPEMLVIADSKRAIAIAGVIGGEETAVTERTKRVVIEVANFEPLTTRRTSQRLGIRTDSVLHFEKGLPVHLAQLAVQRAAELLKKYADAQVLRYADRSTVREQPLRILLLHAAVERLSGIRWKTGIIQSLLKRCGCDVVIIKKKSAVWYRVTPPWYRRDIRLSEDLIEELIRLYGVWRIPEQQLQGTLRVGKQQPDVIASRHFKELLVAAGATEVQHYSLYGLALAAQAGFDVSTTPHVELQNPLSDDLRYLRASLLPRLFVSAAQHQQHESRGIIFEIGHLFSSHHEGQYLSVLIYGSSESYRGARGILEYCLRGYNVVPSQRTQQSEDVGLRIPGTALPYCIENDEIASVGIVEPRIAQSFGLEGGVAVALISLSRLILHSRTSQQIIPLSLYPSVPLDLSIIVDDDVPWSRIENEVRHLGGQLLQSLDVFDVYRGAGVPLGKKSISFHMVFQSSERTLTMQEIEQWRNRLVHELSTVVGAVLRDQ